MRLVVSKEKHEWFKKVYNNLFITHNNLELG